MLAAIASDSFIAVVMTHRADRATLPKTARLLNFPSACLLRDLSTDETITASQPNQIFNWRNSGDSAAQNPPSPAISSQRAFFLRALRHKQTDPRRR